MKFCKFIFKTSAVVVTIMSYGNIIVTVRYKIQLVEIILFSLRQNATVLKTTEACLGCLKC